MIYGYARVSTNGQAVSGNSLEAQEKVLKEAGAELMYFDAFTGTKKHRPQFDILMNSIKEGDTLIVTKLDRIARSAAHGTEIIMSLLEKGVRVNVLNLGIMDNSPSAKLIRTIFFAFAEFERDMIVERTLEGKAIARTNPNYTEGRPRKDVSGFEDLLEENTSGKITVSQCCERLGISRSQWYRLKKTVCAKNSVSCVTEK